MSRYVRKTIINNRRSPPSFKSTHFGNSSGRKIGVWGILPEIYHLLYMEIIVGLEIDRFHLFHLFFQLAERHTQEYIGMMSMRCIRKSSGMPWSYVSGIALWKIWETGENGEFWKFCHLKLKNHFSYIIR